MYACLCGTPTVRVKRALQTMQRRLLAVSVAVLAPALVQAFVGPATGSSGARSSVFPGRTALASSAAPPQRNQEPITMAAAAIVGGGRIGCALYVSANYEFRTGSHDPLHAAVAVAVHTRLMRVIMCHDLAACRDLAPCDHTTTRALLVHMLTFYEKGAPLGADRCAR